MPSCFVIMPVTTPDAFVPHYGGDADHFRHVLDCLFLPAIRAANLEPIPPIAKGADVIQAVIIENLFAADLVLCDISALNPNVFFELGCRTALNKPVCYVKDDLTGGIPFDNSIINHYTYRAALHHWMMAEEIGKLSKHIIDSIERSRGKNSLWQYFGIQAAAGALGSGDGSKDKLDVVIMQMESLKKSVDEIRQSSSTSVSTADVVFPAVTTTSSADDGAFGVAKRMYVQQSGSPWFTWLQDDQKTLKDAVNDLDQIEKLRSAAGPPGSLEPLKSTLRKHRHEVAGALARGLSESDVRRANEIVRRIDKLLE